MANANLKEVSYICSYCKQKRQLKIDVDLHLQRRELTINGLASYIDIHTTDNENLDQKMHGVKLFIDPNFHVRTNDLIKLSVNNPMKKKLAIPLPGMKITQLNTTYTWKSWERLELTTQSDYLQFILKNESHETENLEDTQMEFKSQLGTVSCKLIPKYDPYSSSEAVIENTVAWIEAFIKYVEIIPAIHTDLIPEILRYIDINCNYPLTYADEIVLSLLIDQSAILLPYKEGLETLCRYGSAIHLNVITPEDLTRIAETLSHYDSVRMADIQSILKSEMIEDSELEEEKIVFTLAYLFHLDLFKYKLSFLIEGKI